MEAKRRAKITALGRYVPPKVVTNYDLAKRVATTNDWIVERTGIIERHMVEPGTPTSELAAQAMGESLQRRGIEADEIEVIIELRPSPPDMFSVNRLMVKRRGSRPIARGASTFPQRAPDSHHALTVRRFVESGAHKRW
jgi:3-oxoacyl-[acyl-carrier-protein] synthase-3